jgi:hypothetical protein
VTRLLSYLLAVPAGAAAAVAGAFWQAATWRGQPVGVIVVLAGTTAVVLFIGSLSGHRGAATVATFAWIATALWLSMPRPDGDVIVAAGWTGYSWLFGGMGLSLTATAISTASAGYRPRR